MTGWEYKTAVSEVGQPLIGSRNHKGDVTDVKDV